MTYTTFWLIISGICLIVEVFTVGFLMFFPGLGAFLAFLAALLGFNFIIQSIVFSVSTIIMIIFARPMITKLFKQKETPAMNSEYLIGKTATVIKKISSNSPMGQVKVSGELWSAMSNEETEIDVDKKVIISSIDGVKLLVKEIKN